MKGILFVLDSAGEPVGGIEGKVLLIAEDLHKRGLFAPVLITGDPQSYFSRQFMALGFPVYGFPMRHRSDLRSAAERAEPIVRKHNVVLMQSHRFRESIAARRIRRAFPEIRHVSRVHTHIEGHEIPRWRKTIYHILDWWTSGYVDACVPISTYLTKELNERSWIPRRKIHVVQNGVPPLGTADELSEGNQPLTRAAAVIGDLEKRKQQDLAVKAIGILHKRGMDVDLHIIGRDRQDEFSNAALIQNAIREFGIEHLVHMHGYQPHDRLGGLLRDVPVVMLPSLFEGVPTCIIEGMSMKKLVVATPAGATAELVEDGVNGFLHDPKDASALAAILENVFTTPGSNWNGMRQAGYVTWRDRFSVDAMMGGLLRVYNNLGILDSPCPSCASGVEK